MSESAKYIRELIEKEVFIPRGKERSVSTSGNDSRWIFDFRKIIMRPKVVDLITDLFLEKFPDTLGIQIGGIEVAAIPLVTGITMSLHSRGREVTGFFIRKSRKKYGLLHMIEGEVTGDKIILVDDIMNTGKSLIRQVEVIEAMGKKVDAVFTILRFRDLEYYQYFHDKGIEIFSTFSLDDFKETLGTRNTVDKNEAPVPTPFKAEWLFKSENPDYFYVHPKSAPLLDKNKIYFGSDNGTFWALRQSDGRVAWKYQILGRAKKKMIFSSPVSYQDCVYFGSFDGNFYALDKETGKKKWVFMEADWVRSSPAISHDLGLVFVGMEFGLWNKRGGLVALDALTGEKRWQYLTPGANQASPAYSGDRGIVLMGTNDGVVRCFAGGTGKLVWEMDVGSGINGTFSFLDNGRKAVFSTSDAHVYLIDTTFGDVIRKIEVGIISLYSTPLVYKDKIYTASLDKNTYCHDLNTGRQIWQFETKGRIFAAPEIADGKIYIGSNDGRLYELDPETGKNTAFFQAVERITDKITYNSETKKFFVPTFANEIYCLKKGS